jgi:uncharacterized protein HemX
MPPNIDNFLMSETSRILLNLASSLLLALLTGILGWMFRGKRESQKLKVEIDQLEFTRRKEELHFREELMTKINELQRKVYELERIVEEQREELHDLKYIISEKDAQIKNLQQNKPL